MKVPQFNVLNTIIEIEQGTKDSRMNHDNLSPIGESLRCFADYLQVGETQAMFFAVIFSLNYQERNVTIEEVADHFDLNPLSILPYHRELEDLIDAGYLESKSHMRRNTHLANRSLKIPNYLVKAVLENRATGIVKEPVEKDFPGFLQELGDLFEQRMDDSLLSWHLFDEAKALMEYYSDVEELQKVEKLGLEVKEKLFYFHVCKNTLTGSTNINVHGAVEDIFDKIRDRLDFKKQLFQERSALFEYDLLEWGRANFRNQRTVRLSPKSLNMLFGTDAGLFMNQQQMNHVIRPGDIKENMLFYNPEEEERIGFLRDMMKQDRLGELQERLREKNMPQGITVLMHGSPGTGKTETARQLARQTGREIIHVDLSDAKSMWFGESEKKVREIFDSYRNYAREKEMLPVLLFNEADALFAKRRDTNRSNVAQTENAIQNILLEQLEEFDGILMATTNLTKNLDTAFDRRFLYKIRFREPSVKVKSRIWQSKIPGLPEESSRMLAREYSFSGGQIDNVARKVVTEEVLYGHKPDFGKIRAFCDDELIRKENKRIGYRR